jgi:superfamily II DNA helicase RecQ
VQADRFPLFGVLAGCTQKRIGEQILQLREQGFLADFSKGEHLLLRLTDEGKRWLAAHPKDKATAGRPAIACNKQVAAQPATRAQSGDLTDYDQALFEQLRAWRLEKAKELSRPPYIIFHDSVLKRIAASRPTSLGELAAIQGIGPRKLEQYGPAVLDIVGRQESRPVR